MAADHDYREGGLKMKYRIEKLSGNPLDPEARYFVLRYDADPHAQVALAAYAESVADENPVLADDLRRELLEVAKGDNDAKGE
jgi:hypothetical protein